MAGRPPLSVIVTVRENDADLGEVFAVLIPQARRTGTEVLLVGPVREAAPPDVRVVPLDDPDIFRLRMVGLREARGEIVALGEDHAVPRPDWCDAILRAHAENPEIAAVAGCLVNATDRTVSGRANFLAFAAHYSPPMPVLPPFPPPVSALSFKRDSVAQLDGRIGAFETEVVPRLHATGQMVADDRARVDHYQDEGIAWSIANAFHSARSGYGYHGLGLDRAQRWREARWSIVNWPRRILVAARLATRGRDVGTGEKLLVAVLALAFGVGGAVGALTGPGRSPARVA